MQRTILIKQIYVTIEVLADKKFKMIHDFMLGLKSQQEQPVKF